MCLEDGYSFNKILCSMAASYCIIKRYLRDRSTDFQASFDRTFRFVDFKGFRCGELEVDRLNSLQSNLFIPSIVCAARL